MWVLKTHSKAPPGGYPYEQREGIRKKFGTTFDILDDARKVADFRKGNNLSRATVALAMEDIDTQTCERIGNDPRYCRNTDQTYIENTPKLQKGRRGCATCGKSKA